MRRRRKSDWFAIVATDLFCGALCAVIILDAVSKRAPSAIDGPGRLTLSHDRPDAGCSSVLIVARLDSASGYHLLATTGSVAVGGQCVADYDLPDLTGLQLRQVVLAKGTEDVVVDIEALPVLPRTRCSTRDVSC